VETPSFTFRLERVRTIRERAEDLAREELNRELEARTRADALLREAAGTVTAARTTGRNAALASGTSVATLLAAQAFLERAERTEREAALNLDRQDAEVAIRRDVYAAAARDRQAIDKLEERQRAEHDAEWARRAQIAQDEIALGMHRRGGAVV
jgi:flagellar protein FliJ